MVTKTEEERRKGCVRNWVGGVGRGLWELNIIYTKWGQDLEIYTESQMLFPHNHRLCQVFVCAREDVLALVHAVDRKPAGSMLFSPHYLKADLSIRASLFQIIILQTNTYGLMLLSPPTFSPFCSFKKSPRVTRSLKRRPYSDCTFLYLCLSWPLAICYLGNRQPMRKPIGEVRCSHQFGPLHHFLNTTDKQSTLLTVSSFW